MSKGKTAIVDAADYDRASLFKWHFSHCGKTTDTGYAQRTWREAGMKKHQRLHHFILNAPPGSRVDHVNGNPLDNRRVNLRIASRSVNSLNSRSHRPYKRSQYKGVVKHQSRIHPWVAQIQVNKKRIHLGMFTTEEEAAKAYDKAFRLHVGRGTGTNFQDRESGADT